MLIKYEGKEYEFSLDDISVRQLAAIAAHFGGMNLGELETGLVAGDPNSLIAIYWFMLENNGDHIPLENIDFKVVKFYKAFQVALMEEQKQMEAADEIAKTWGRTPKKESADTTTSESA